METIFRKIQWKLYFGKFDETIRFIEFIVP